MRQPAFGPGVIQEVVRVFLLPKKTLLGCDRAVERYVLNRRVRCDIN